MAASAVLVSARTWPAMPSACAAVTWLGVSSVSRALPGSVPTPGQCQPEDAAVRLGDACLTGQHHGVGQTGHAVGRQPGPGMRPGAGDDGGPRPALDPAEAGQELLVPPPPRRDVSRPSAERRRLMLSRRLTCRHRSSSLIWPVRTVQSLPPNTAASTCLEVIASRGAHACAVPGQRRSPGHRPGRAGPAVSSQRPGGPRPWR
jgi:hypothetical protein